MTLHVWPYMSSLTAKDHKHLREILSITKIDFPNKVEITAANVKVRSYLVFR